MKADERIILVQHSLRAMDELETVLGSSLDQVSGNQADWIFSRLHRALLHSTVNWASGEVVSLCRRLSLQPRDATAAGTED